MDQIYNSMLYMTQTPAERPASKPSQNQEKDSFHKQLEQASGKGESKTDTAVQDQPQEGQVVTEDPRELEKQMALAAMAVMQNPVIPVEQVTAPEETAVTDVAGVELVVETADVQVADAPVTAETVEIAPPGGCGGGRGAAAPGTGEARGGRDPDRGGHRRGAGGQGDHR